MFKSKFLEKFDNKFFRVASVICALAILFMPLDSNAWVYLGLLAIIFGISWFK